MKGRSATAVLLGIAILAAGVMSVSAHRAPRGSIAHGGPPSATSGPGHSRVVIEVFDQGIEVLLQGEHADNLDRRVADAHLVNASHFSCRLTDMALDSSQTSARYLHATGAVKEVDVHQDGKDLGVDIHFRHPMSTYQVGIGGGFIIDIRFT
jgi:hypothetical protein